MVKKSIIRVSLKSNPRTPVPDHIVGLSKDYDVLLGEPGCVAQLRVFQAMVTSLRYLKAEGRALSDAPNGTIESVQSLTGANLVPVDVEPCFFSVIAMPLTNPPEELIHKLILEWRADRWVNYKECNCRKPDVLWINEHKLSCMTRRAYECNNGDPKYFAVGAFITGGSAEGVRIALENILKNRLWPVMERPIDHYREKPLDIQPLFAKDIVLAFAQMFAHCPSELLDPCQFTPAAIAAIPFKKGVSCGYLNVAQYEERLDDVIWQFVNTGHQENAYLSVKDNLNDLAKKVASEISTGKYSVDWFPRTMAKIAVKAEVKGPLDDVKKTRIFFIMSMLKLLIDKLLYVDIFPQFYGRGRIGIGFKWAGGGAEALAQELGAYDPNMGYFEYDFSKLDQTLLPGMLTLLFSLCMSRVKRTEELTEGQIFAREIMRAFMTDSADSVAVTLVKWVGNEYRWVIGVMFSGLYGTSWGDSLYVAVANRTFEFYLHRILRRERPDLEASFVACKKKGKIYGDNCILAYPKTIVEFMTRTKTDHQGIEWKFGLIEEFFSKNWGLTLKRDECRVHIGQDPFFSTILTHRDPQGRPLNTFVERPGLNYLKRSFVRFEEVGVPGVFAMPFRPTTDYFSKAAITAKEVTNPLIWPSRWIGLLIDSAGTNEAAWDFLSSLIVKFMERSYGLTQDDAWEEFLENSGIYDDADFQNRLKKSGVTPDQFTRRLSRAEMLKLFSPNSR